jgi:hypothetical protein
LEDYSKSVQDSEIREQDSPPKELSMPTQLEDQIQARNKEHAREASAKAQENLKLLRQALKEFNLKNHNIRIGVDSSSAVLVIQERRTQKWHSITPPKDTELICTLDVLQGIIEARENFWWVSKLPSGTFLTEEDE